MAVSSSAGEQSSSGKRTTSCRGTSKATRRNPLPLPRSKPRTSGAQRADTSSCLVKRYRREREMCCGLPLRCGGCDRPREGKREGRGYKYREHNGVGACGSRAPLGRGLRHSTRAILYKAPLRLRPPTPTPTRRRRAGERAGVSLIRVDALVLPSVLPHPTTTTWATVRRLLSRRRRGLLLREDDADLGGAEEALLDHVCGRKARDVVQRLREGSRHDDEMGSGR